MKDKDWFTMEQMSDLQMELLIKCLRHDIYWTKVIMKSYLREMVQQNSIRSILALREMVERKAKSVYNMPLKTEIKRVEAET